MNIKILGSGCKNCITLERNTKAALDTLGMDTQIEKITDFDKIMQYGIMTMPAIVIDEKVVSFGKVLKPKEITEIIKKENK